MQSDNDSSPQEEEAAVSIVSYEGFRRVLLLGEADFSFTRAFSRAMMTSTSTPMELTATEYGSPTQLASRYYDNDIVAAKAAVSNIQELKFVKEVICNLNARLLGKNNNNATTTTTNDNDNTTNNRRTSNNDDECLCQRWNAETHDWDGLSSFWNNNVDVDSQSSLSLSSYYDLIIFNFPHTSQRGRTGKLLQVFFKQVRICIQKNRLPSTVVVEMRLRFIPTLEAEKKNIRSHYKHEEAARESHFRLVGKYEGDLETWEEFGYQHKITRRAATCGDIGKDCTVWRWTSE